MLAPCKKIFHAKLIIFLLIFSILFPAHLLAQTTTGNTVIVSIAVYNKNIPTNGVVDNKGNTYTKIAEVTNGSDHAALFYAKNVTGGASFTASSTITGVSIAAYEYSGVNFYRPLDKFASTTGTSNTPTSPSITTSTSTELYIGLAWSGGSGDVWTAGSGFTLRENEIDNNLHERFALEDKVITSATTTTATFTTTTSSSWSALIASFIPATSTTLSSGGGYSTTTFAYDSNGNLASTSAGLTNTWDYNNRLTQTTLGNTKTSYLYDHAGTRVRYSNGFSTTTYPSKYYDLTATSSTKHYFVGDQLIATVQGTPTATSTYYVHADHLGSPTIITNASSTITETTDYYPYGQTKVDTRTSGQNESRKYIGERVDQDTSLSYLNARYYDGQRGQFLSLDPVFLGDAKNQNLKDPQSLNSYSYANGNPIMKKDPLGKQYVDVNAGFTFPQCLCGPTGGFYVAPGTSDPIVYLGIGVSFRPGFSGSVTYSPTGSPSEGLSESVGGFTKGKVGGQVGPPQNSSQTPSGEIGIGTPGIGASVTYSMSLSKVVSNLGGSFQYITTPMTTNPTINYNYNNFNQSFGSNTGPTTIQSRINTVSNYNTSTGATSNQSKLWVTPSGAVVTWSGAVVSGPVDRSQWKQ